MSSDPDEIASTAADEIGERGWTNFVRDFGLGGVFLAIVYALIEVINSAGSTLLRPFQAFGEGIATLIGGTFGAPVRVIDAGATASVQSFTEGAAQFLGPAALPVAMVSAVAALWIFQRFWSRIQFSPIDFLRNAR